MIVSTMIVTYTAAGTPVIELTPEEHAAYLEREVQSAMGMSVAEFIRAYTAAELEDATWRSTRWSVCCVSARTGTKLPRRVAQGLADRLNGALNRTVSDSRLSVGRSSATTRMRLS